MTAPHLLTGLEKVQQIYSGLSGGHTPDINELQTMHTSDANLASKKFMQYQNHQQPQNAPN